MVWSALALPCPCAQRARLPRSYSRCRLIPKDTSPNTYTVASESDQPNRVTPLTLAEGANFHHYAGHGG